MLVTDLGFVPIEEGLGEGSSALVFDGDAPIVDANHVARTHVVLEAPSIVQRIVQMTFHHVQAIIEIQDLLWFLMID